MSDNNLHFERYKHRCEKTYKRVITKFEIAWCKSLRIIRH